MQSERAQQTRACRLHSFILRPQPRPHCPKPQLHARFADSIHSELSTAEVVAKYVAPQTSQLRCRFVDLVSERATDTPGYYVMHCWSMRFRTLVRALREHFELQKVWGIVHSV